MVDENLRIVVEAAAGRDFQRITFTKDQRPGVVGDNVVIRKDIVSVRIGGTGHPNENGAINALDSRPNMGSRAAIWLAQGSGKKLLADAAKTHVAKLLRGNAVAAAVTTVVLSVGDIHRLMNGRISFGQAFKNISTTAAGAVSGGIGMQTGAAIGASVGSALPIVGTVAGAFVGGFIGSLIGGTAGAAVTNGALGLFIEDDAKEMFRLFQDVLAEQAANFLLSEAETDSVFQRIQELDLQDVLFKMYAAPNHRRYAIMIIRPIIMTLVESRPQVSLPDEAAVLDVTKRLLAAA